MKPHEKQTVLQHEIDVLKVHLQYFTTQCDKWQKLMYAKYNSIFVLSIMENGIDKAIVEEPKVDRAEEVQQYLKHLANQMADFYQAKVLTLAYSIEQLQRQLTDIQHSTETGKGGANYPGNAGEQPGDVATFGTQT